MENLDFVFACDMPNMSEMEQLELCVERSSLAFAGGANIHFLNKDLMRESPWLV